MSVNEEMKKVKNISKKEVLVLLLIAIVLLLIYSLSSGILKASVPYKNIMTTAKPEVVAESDGWGIYTIDKEGMLPYFAYNGVVVPSESIHVRIVFFDSEGNMIKDEWYPWYDRHLFAGEHRYYFPEKRDDLSKFAVKIVWNRGGSQDTNATYMFSDNLSGEEKEKASSYIDKIQVNENDVVNISK